MILHATLLQDGKDFSPILPFFLSCCSAATLISMQQGTKKGQYTEMDKLSKSVLQILELEEMIVTKTLSNLTSKTEVLQQPSEPQVKPILKFLIK